MNVRCVTDLGGLARLVLTAPQRFEQATLPFLAVEHHETAAQPFRETPERSHGERSAGDLPVHRGPRPVSVTPVPRHDRCASVHLDPEGNDLFPQEGRDPADGTGEGERLLPDGGIPVHGLGERYGAQRVLQDPGQDPDRRLSGRDLADPQVLTARGLHRLKALVEVRLLDPLLPGEAGGGPAPAAALVPCDPPRGAQDFANLIRLGLGNPGAMDHQPARGAAGADRFRRQPFPIETFGDRRLKPLRETCDPVGGNLLAPDLDEEFLPAHGPSR